MSETISLHVEPWQRDVIILQTEESIESLKTQLKNMEELRRKLVNGSNQEEPPLDTPPLLKPKKRGRKPKAKVEPPSDPPQLSDDPPAGDEDLMDAIEVAEFLGTGVGNVHVLRQKGKLPDCQRVGKKNMWKREDIEQFQKTWTAGRGKKKL